MSSRTPTTAADGSAASDADDRRRIDRSGTARWRWRCPRGHVDWDETNNHVWCRSCRREAEQGADVDPEWWEIVDARTGETIPWSSVDVIEPGASARGPR